MVSRQTECQDVGKAGTTHIVLTSSEKAACSLKRIYAILTFDLCWPGLKSEV